LKSAGGLVSHACRGKLFVTAPLASDRYSFAPGARGAATLRSRWEPFQSLILSRLKRGIRRQWPLALLITTAIAGLGVAYDVGGGVQPLASALFWLPLGLAAGLAAGMLREFGRNTITSLSSLGKHRGYSVLGAAPELDDRALRQLPPDRRTPLGCLAFQPASPFATAFRDLQGAVAAKSMVAFIAATPNEGATTAALSTAVSATQQGRSVVVVDCDLRRRSLTRNFEGDAVGGVLEACEVPESWRDFIVEENETGVHLMPAAGIRNPWRSSLIENPGFTVLLGMLREAYDLVVLDCPPVFTSAEGKLIAAMADKSVVVAAWDQTPLSIVNNAMRAMRQRTRSIAGIYVNRVPPGYRFGRLRPD
jgi:Mrp family chromosome partitioning ATPase